MKWFKSLSRTAQLMVYSLVGLFVLFIVLGFIINSFYDFEPMWKYSIGLTSGILLSIIKVFSMDKSIEKIVSMDEPQAKTRGQFYFGLRYLLTFVYVALVIVLRDYIGLFGAIIGMLALQLSAFTANALLIREEKKQAK